MLNFPARGLKKKKTKTSRLTPRGGGRRACSEGGRESGSEAAAG
jgi:hypothetical protein